uniref:Uncharacterized protein n=1 Tax=Oryza rufipogon TaxID=4529 RepID=A0A0E0PX24_ORYRU
MSRPPRFDNISYSMPSSPTTATIASPSSSSAYRCAPRSMMPFSASMTTPCRPLHAMWLGYLDTSTVTSATSTMATLRTITLITIVSHALATSITTQRAIIVEFFYRYQASALLTLGLWGNVRVYGASFVSQSLEELLRRKNYPLLSGPFPSIPGGFPAVGKGGSSASGSFVLVASAMDVLVGFFSGEDSLSIIFQVHH